MQPRSHGTCQPYPWPRDNYNVLDGHLKSFGPSMRVSFLSRIRLPCQETVNLLRESGARSGAGGFAQCAVVFKVSLVEPLGIAPAGNRRDIVEVTQQMGSCERLDNAEIERGAADTSARKGQPDERIARRPARWRFVQTEPPGHFDLLEFVTENVLEGERTHCYLARSAYLTQ